MFEGKLYITRGIDSEVPPEITLLLWSMIQKARIEIELDYLQVFQLSVSSIGENPAQVIRHHQEQPPYCKEIVFPCMHPVNAKIFCIDDVTHDTMLLASEY